MRHRPTFIEIALAAGGVSVFVFALAIREWLMAFYMGVGVAALVVIASHRWRTGEYLVLLAGAALTKAQQMALGYVFSLPFWGAMWIYQHGHPAVLVAFILGTVAAGIAVAFEIRRDGWSRHS